MTTQPAYTTPPSRRQPTARMISPFIKQPARAIVDDGLIKMMPSSIRKTFQTCTSTYGPNPVFRHDRQCVGCHWRPRTADLFCCELHADDDSDYEFMNMALTLYRRRPTEQLAPIVNGYLSALEAFTRHPDVGLMMTNTELVTDLFDQYTLQKGRLLANSMNWSTSTCDRMPLQLSLLEEEQPVQGARLTVLAAFITALQNTRKTVIFCNDLSMLGGVDWLGAGDVTIISDLEQEVSVPQRTRNMEIFLRGFEVLVQHANNQVVLFGERFPAGVEAVNVNMNLLLQTLLYSNLRWMISNLKFCTLEIHGFNRNLDDIREMVRLLSFHAQCAGVQSRRIDECAAFLLRFNHNTTMQIRYSPDGRFAARYTRSRAFVQFSNIDNL